MTKIIKTIAIVSTIAGSAAVALPALKGPLNRIRNEANERLNDEYVVDNYKAEYVKLHGKKVEIEKNLDKFKVELKVVEKKMAVSNDKVSFSKAKLKEIGTSNLREFNLAKDAYESFKTERENLISMGNVYSNAISKLEKSLFLVKENMRKAKSNVDILSSKKILVDSIKGVNETISNLEGIGDDPSLGIALEKLDETALREGIRLEAISERNLPGSASTEVEAKAYLEKID